MIAHHCSTELMYSVDTNASSYLSHSHLHTNKQNGRQLFLTNTEQDLSFGHLKYGLRKLYI